MQELDKQHSNGTLTRKVPASGAKAGRSEAIAGAGIIKKVSQI